METLLLWRIDRAPSWLEYVFVRETGSNEDAVEAEPLEAGCNIVTDMSLVCFVLALARSRALETRVGTSERSEEVIYALSWRWCFWATGRKFVTLAVFQIRLLCMQQSRNGSEAAIEMCYSDREL